MTCKMNHRNEDKKLDKCPCGNKSEFTATRIMEYELEVRAGAVKYEEVVSDITVFRCHKCGLYSDTEVET